MNQYYAIAWKYYCRFQSLAHYDSFFTWKMAAFVLGSIGMCFGFALAIANASFGQFWDYIGICIASEVAMLAGAVMIEARRRENIVKAINAEYSTRFEDVKSCKARVLQDLLNRPRHEFFQAAQETCDLLALDDRMRMPIEMGWAECVEYVYNPDSKARILALALALVTVVITLLFRTDESRDMLLGALSSAAYWKLLLQFTYISVAAFIVLIGLQLAVRQVLHVLGSKLIMLQGENLRSRRALKFLIRDLAQLHRQKPRKASVQAPEGSRLACP